MDKITVDELERSRIFEAIEESTKKADGKVVILVDGEEIFMSENMLVLNVIILYQN